MTEAEIARAFEALSGRDNRAAYAALQMLREECRRSSRVYSRMDRLDSMLDSGSSYIRTRALTLIAYNARWDKDNKINRLIGRYLAHITDAKPVTARQCVQLLPNVAAHKPELRDRIVQALEEADTSIYNSSMRPLVCQDIRRALAEIRRL